MHLFLILLLHQQHTKVRKATPYWCKVFQYRPNLSFITRNGDFKRLLRSIHTFVSCLPSLQCSQHEGSVASTPRGIFLVIIWMRIFFSIFFSNFLFQIFLSKFSSKFFLRIFLNFFPNFFSKFTSKFFRDLFRGFRTQDTRVLRAPHARHTRVASTPRGIFLVIISMRIFLSKFSSKFFPRIFFNFFSQIFFLKIFSGFVSRVSHARHTRVANTPRETHVCCKHPTRDFSRDYINETFFVKFFFQIFFFEIFLSKFSSKFFLRIFFQIFFPIFFSKFFCQNFPQNFFPEFFSNFFSNFFYQIFLSKFSSIFSQNFFPIFFPIFFQNFFVKTPFFKTMVKWAEYCNKRWLWAFGALRELDVVVANINGQLTAFA